MIKLKNIKCYMINFNPHKSLIFKPNIIKFIINNTYLEISNVIRRMVIDEIKIKRMICNIENIETNDKFIIKENIIDRLNQIDINQQILTNTRFSIDVNASNINKNVLTDDIYSDEIVKQMFNKNIILLELRANKYIKIDNIRIIENYGYKNGIFGHAYSSISEHCVNDNEHCVNDNEHSVNDTLNSCSSNKSHSFKHIIETTGEINVQNLFQMITNEIIERLQNLLLISIESSENIHKLVINNESYTIGELIQKYIARNIPEIEHVSYVCKEPRILIITIKNNSNDEVQKIIKKLVEFYIQEFRSLNEQIKALNIKYININNYKDFIDINNVF